MEGTSDGSNETVGSDEGVFDGNAEGCDDGSSDIEGLSVGCGVAYAPLQRVARQKA